jgi:hypothetical protein
MKFSHNALFSNGKSDWPPVLFGSSNIESRPDKARSEQPAQPQSAHVESKEMIVHARTCTRATIDSVDQLTHGDLV